MSETDAEIRNIHKILSVLSLSRQTTALDTVMLPFASTVKEEMGVEIKQMDENTMSPFGHAEAMLLDAQPNIMPVENGAAQMMMVIIRLAHDQYVWLEVCLLAPSCNIIRGGAALKVVQV